MNSLGTKHRNKKSPPADQNPASKPLRAPFLLHQHQEQPGGAPGALGKEQGALIPQKREAGELQELKPSCPSHSSPAYSKAANSRDSRSLWKGWGGKSLEFAGARWVLTRSVWLHMKGHPAGKLAPNPTAPSARLGLSPSG